MLGRAEDLQPAFNGTLGTEQTRLDLGAQDAAYGFVHARHGDFAGPDLGQCIRVKRPPAVRRHQHVHPGIDRRGAALV